MHSNEVLAPSLVRVWFRWYCGSMALVYFACAGFGIILFVAASGDLDMRRSEALFTGIFMAGVSASVFAAFVLGLFLPRRPWAWVYGLVLICLGMTSLCCLPVCIPMLIGWMRDDAKRHFGRAAAAPDPRDFSSESR